MPPSMGHNRFRFASMTQQIMRFHNSDKKILLKLKHHLKAFWKKIQTVK